MSAENESDGEEMETDIKPPSEDRAGGDGNSNTEEEMKKMDAEGIVDLSTNIIWSSRERDLMQKVRRSRLLLQIWSAM